MRDRDYEEDTLSPIPEWMKRRNMDSVQTADTEMINELPLRYILFTGEMYDKIGGAAHQHSIHPTIIDAADTGEREYLRSECDWFNVLDAYTLNTYDQNELQRLTSERNHREAVERQRAYRGE